MIFEGFCALVCEREPTAAGTLKDTKDAAETPGRRHLRIRKTLKRLIYASDPQNEQNVEIKNLGSKKSFFLTLNKN